MKAQANGGQTAPAAGRCPTTAPSGATVPSEIRADKSELEALTEQIEGMRYCPLADHYGRCVDLALRLLNAERAARSSVQS